MEPEETSNPKACLGDGEIGSNKGSDDELDESLMASFEAEMRRRMLKDDPSFDDFYHPEEDPAPLNASFTNESELSYGAGASSVGMAGSDFDTDAAKDSPTSSAVPQLSSAFSFRGSNVVVVPNNSAVALDVQFINALLTSKGATIAAASKKVKRVNRFRRRNGAVSRAWDKLIWHSLSLQRNRLTDFDAEFFPLSRVVLSGRRPRTEKRRSSISRPTFLVSFRKYGFRKGWRARHVRMGTFLNRGSLFSCSACPSLFRSSAELGRHLRARHPCGKNFACDRCRRRFLTNKHRLEHVRRRHVELRSRPCQDCSAVFRRRYAFRLHRCFVHGDALRLRATAMSLCDDDNDIIGCDICGGSFYSELEFDRHRRRCRYDVTSNPSSIASSADNRPKERCPFCVLQFPDVVALKRHTDEFHGPKSVLTLKAFDPEGEELLSAYCSACDADFPSDFELKRHFAKRHKSLRIVEADWWSWDGQGGDWVQHERPLLYAV